MITKQDYMKLRKQLEKAGFERLYTVMAGENGGTLYRHEKTGFEFTWNSKLEKKDILNIVDLYNCIN